MISLSRLGNVLNYSLLGAVVILWSIFFVARKRARQVVAIGLSLRTWVRQLGIWGQRYATFHEFSRFCFSFFMFWHASVTTNSFFRQHTSTNKLVHLWDMTFAHQQHDEQSTGINIRYVTLLKIYINKILLYVVRLSQDKCLLDEDKVRGFFFRLTKANLEQVSHVAFLCCYGLWIRWVDRYKRLVYSI